jgi:hypothetical protein
VEKNKDKVQSTVASVLKYGAIAVVACGILYAILSAVGMSDYSSGPAQAGQFFWGLLWAVVGGGVLYALSELVSPQK